MRAANTPPGILAGNPDCVSWGENRVDCFDLGEGGVVYHSWWDGPGTAWSNWVTLGAVLVSTPSCVTYPILILQRIDCVGVRGDGVAFHTAWNGNSWSSWETFPPTNLGVQTLAGPPTCVQSTWDLNGRTQNFVCAALLPDGTLGSWALDTVTSPAESYWLTGSNPSAPTFSSVSPSSCVSWGSDRLDCFDVKQDGTPFHISVEPPVLHGFTVGVESLTPGALLFPPSCVSLKVNDFDCIGVGTDNQPYHDGWNGATWSGWTPLGGTLRDPPSCVTWGGNHIECIGVGTDNQVYRSYSDDYGISWSSWDLTAPGPLANAAFPSCVSWGAGRIDCVGIGTDDQAYHMALDASTHSWSSWDLIGCGATNCNSPPPSSPTSTESSLTILYNSNLIPLTKSTTSTSSLPPLQTFNTLLQTSTASTTAGGATSPPSTITTGTIQPTQVQTSSSGATQTSQGSSASQQATLTQTQTVTEARSTSQTSSFASNQQAQLASQPDVLGMLQQNSLLLIAAGALVVLLAVMALRRRGGLGTSEVAKGASSKADSETVLCGQCGASNPTTSKYCGKCGEKINSARS